MSPEYPSPGMAHLVRRLQNSDVSEIDRDWTGNDESARHNHNRVSLNESPLKLRLSWKHTVKDSSHLIGIYELDLRRLLEAAYVRLEPKTENEIRLRFYHGHDNLIYIQVNSNAPGLPIGRVP
jgi:hypothetical protein